MNKQKHCSSSSCIAQGCDDCSVCNGFEGEMFKEPPLAPMTFYILAEAVCEECNHVQKVKINWDDKIYHECNKGNRTTIVPRLKVPVTPYQKLLLKGK